MHWSLVKRVPSNPSNVQSSGHESKLAGLAFLGQCISYAVALLPARHLGVEGFQAYAVASAVFILMAVVAPRGSEKYALRLLPVLIEQRDWARARGYMLFGLRRTLLTAMVLGALVGTWAASVRELSDATRLAILVTVLSLPAGALVHYGLEVLSAWGREFTALALFRIVVPGLVLVFVCMLLVSSAQISGAMAIACWGIAWLLVLLLMAWQMTRVMPKAISDAVPEEELEEWKDAARPFFVYRLSAGLLAQSAVIALDWLQPSAAATSAYAAAASTVGLVAVLATATNRAYARQLSLLLERREYDTILLLRRKRLRWMLPLIGVFLLVSFIFTREVLGLFGPGFVEEGVAALRLLAIATAFTVLFALAPTYLKYQGRNRATYVAVSCTAALQVLLLLVLVPRFGAAGAAVAYALSLCGMYTVLAVMAHGELTTLRGR